MLSFHRALLVHSRGFYNRQTTASSDSKLGTDYAEVLRVCVGFNVYCEYKVGRLCCHCAIEGPTAIEQYTGSHVPGR